jgi:antitoxin (DNA-binding transcriptional repressor) of toxin-antitoxin stability system
MRDLDAFALFPLTLDIVKNNEYGHAYKRGLFMESMSVTMIKAQALRKIAQVAASREPIVITRHGRPVVTVVPWTEPPSADSSFGKLAGSVLREGDLVYSVSDGTEWESCR